MTTDERIEVVWKALRDFARAEQTYRDLMVLRRDAPTLKRGGKRVALAKLIVLRLAEAERDDAEATK
jgi:hypothetical protein